MEAFAFRRGKALEGAGRPCSCFILDTERDIVSCLWALNGIPFVCTYLAGNWFAQCQSASPPSQYIRERSTVRYGRLRAP